MTAEHVAIIEPDDRGRFHLRKFLGNSPGAKYRVLVAPDHESVTLQRVPDIAD